MREALDVQQSWPTFKAWLMRLYDHTADFELRYYGALNADPTVNPLGGAIIDGDMYFRTSAPVGMMVYRSGAWINYEASSVAASAAATGSATASEVSRVASGVFAGLAATARTAAEAARDLAQAASLASAVALAAKDTIALGRASVADGATFWVKPNPTDSLTRFTNYLRNTSTTQTFVMSQATGTDQDALTERQKLKADLQIGKNLFNPADGAVMGYFMDAAGALSVNAGYNVTPFIRVTAGTVYTVSHKRILAWYDTNKLFLSGDATVTGGTATLTAPAGAFYMRADVTPAQWGIYQVELGSATTVYVPYSPTLLPAQLPDGGVSESKHALASVAYRHTRFLQPGKNLFNPLDPDAVSGFFIDGNTGLLTANASYNETGFIPVSAGVAYTVSYKNQLAWFDASKVFISGSLFADSNKTQTAPAGACYLRAMVANTQWAVFQVEAGAVSTAYEAFKLVLSGPGGAPVSIPMTAGSINTPSLADGAVTLQKTSFFQAGKNKFNKATVTPGFFIDPSAPLVLSASASYDLSDYIPVSPGSAYWTTGSRFTVFFDVNKAPVAGGSSVAVSGFTPPIGAVFMRVSVSHATVNTYQMELGTAATAYESYGLVLQDASGLPLRITYAQLTGAPVTPDTDYLAIAAKQYVPYGKEIAVYHENITKDYSAYKGRTGIAFAGGKEAGPATKLTPFIGQSGTTIAGTATAADAAFVALIVKAFSVIVTDAAKATAVNIQNIGDSYTGRMTWANVILGTTAAAGLTFGGTRTGNVAAVRCEGQGGWAMSTFFSADAQGGSGGFFSPFMQPVTAGYLFYGPTSCWIDANATVPSYNADSFTGTKALFNAATGRKLAPNVNDVMGEAGGFIRWDGSAWVAIASATFGGLAFGYAKYRTAWGIAAPTIVHVLLGTNDFAGATDVTFTASYAAYKTQYDALIASVKADTPAVKFIVGIPVSSGRQGRQGTLDTERRKRGYYLLAKQLSADYGGREAESIYVLDYHSVVDRFYGFDNAYEKPFSDYSGATGDDLFKADTTHLGLDGFKQMGNAYMGLIQFLR
jgi:hypothetical protein